MRVERDIWAAVPVKAFDAAKQRLAPAYAPGFRRELAKVMLEDVLSTLAQASGLGGIVVVTGDPEARLLAGRYGARTLADPAEGGLTGAVMAAARRLAGEGRDGMLALPADIPGITAHEIAHLLDAHPPARGFTIVPAHDRLGSNAILMTPPDAVPLAYGEDSFRRHLARAHGAGIEPVVVPLPGTGLDLDRPDDVASFARQPSLTRTWNFLRAAPPLVERAS